MSEAPLLLPREVGVLALGMGALVAGLVGGHATPTFSHSASVEKAELEVAKNVHELLPDNFRIEATVKKTGLTLLQSEDILLLGGDASDAACSGGALFLYWEDGAFGFGCQCNGPSSAGCPTAAGCSDPAIKGPSKFKPNVEYSVRAEYDRKTEIAAVHVDGELYFSKHVHWTPPRSGPVTLLAGAHTSADTEPFLGEARDIGVWPVPAGSWGWVTIGVVTGLVSTYVGLGAAIGRRTYQRSGSLLDVHPHAPHWKSLSGMISDGIHWTRHGGRSHRSSYSSLNDADRGSLGGHANSKQRGVRDKHSPGQVDDSRAADSVGGSAQPQLREGGRDSSTAVGGGSGDVAQDVPTLVAPTRGVLSSGARETGAKVVY